MLKSLVITYTVPAIKEETKYMPAYLNPTRRVEAKKIVKDLLNSGETDLDKWVSELIKVMQGVPPVVTFAARQLEEWNTEDDHGPDKFQPGSTSYLEITEVVLDAAAVYRGGIHGELRDEPTP